MAKRRLFSATVQQARQRQWCSQAPEKVEDDTEIENRTNLSFEDDYTITPCQGIYKRARPRPN